MAFLGDTAFFEILLSLKCNRRTLAMVSRLGLIVLTLFLGVVAFNAITVKSLYAQKSCDDLPDCNDGSSDDGE